MLSTKTMLSVAPAFSLKIINSGEATEKFILLLILVIHFKVDPCRGGGGDSYMEPTGMLVGNFVFNP